jgi:hypothetical protein
MGADRYHEREFWRALAPKLHIENPWFFERVPSVELTPELNVQFSEDGYLQGHTDWGLDLQLMAGTVRTLSAAGLLPVFAFVYDEFWHPFVRLHLLYSALLRGAYCLLPDFWVWNVDPTKGEAGWKPHRDKGRKALFDDGTPKSITTWIPLSVATPLNGCMYVVPAGLDPTYATADELQIRFEPQSIRALPGKPGDFFVWNQAIYHWGGASSPRAPESRVSIAFELQRADVPAFNTPLIEPLRVLPFESRLSLIATQIHRYRHMYDIDANVARIASDLLERLGSMPANIENGSAPAGSAKPISNQLASGRTIGRNDPCPCGSGKRYKHCHGSLAVP